MSYLFGPRLNLRKFEHFVPFGEFLVGGTRADFKLNGDSNQNSFAIATGGGVDVVLPRNLACPFAQLDYFMTTASVSAIRPTAPHSNFHSVTPPLLPLYF